MIHYAFTILLLVRGSMALFAIKNKHPANSRENAVCWIIIITIIIFACFSLIIQKYGNICAIFYGVTEIIFTYKENKKDKLKPALESYYIDSFDGYKLAFMALFYGILETFGGYFE